MPDTKQRHRVEGEGGLHRDGAKPRIADYIPPDLILDAGKIAAQNCQPREGYPDGKYPDLDGGIPNYKAGIRTSKYVDSIATPLSVSSIAESKRQFLPMGRFAETAHLHSTVMTTFPRACPSSM